jgi:hypothetical protein
MHYVLTIFNVLGYLADNMASFGIYLYLLRVLSNILKIFDVLTFQVFVTLIARLHPMFLCRLVFVY